MSPNTTETNAADGAPNDGPVPTVESLTLRTRPRPVSRLSRKALIGGSAIGAGVVFGAMLFALRPPSVRAVDPALVAAASVRPVNEALGALPTSYEEAARTPLPSGPMPARVPTLGPPLPGDLGSGVIETERSLGIDARELPQSYDDGGLPFVPDAEDEAARIERIRQARITTDAREAGVFFKLRGGGDDVASAIGLSNSPTLGPNTIPVSDDGVVEANPSVGGTYLAPGTVIRASLLTAVNSDLPGTAVAQVTEDVRDSLTGDAVLIPRGTRLIGRYGSEVGAFQSRAEVRWTRMVFPNGREELLSDLPAADPSGAVGLEDEVDRHTGRLVRAGLLSSLLGVGSELAVAGDGGTTQAVRQALQGTTNATGQTLVQRGATAEPTLRIRPGFAFVVVTERTLPLPPYEGTRQ
jgi:type IV secretion system protein VirB10